MKGYQIRARVAGGLIVFTILFIFFRGALVGPSSAIAAARASGFTDVAVIEQQVFLVSRVGCRVYDAARYRLRGKNAEGGYEVLTVCVGWPFASATVRADR